MKGEDKVGQKIYFDDEGGGGISQKIICDSVHNKLNIQLSCTYDEVRMKWSLIVHFLGQNLTYAELTAKQMFRVELNWDWTKLTIN